VTGNSKNPHINHLGVIAEGAWADMLLVDGDPNTNLRLIIKEGRIYKNTLA
jgi:imidazolonepropionase-like amidohydrolase